MRRLEKPALDGSENSESGGKNGEDHHHGTDA